MKKSLFILFASLITLLCGCGYRWGSGELQEQYRTIAVPYAEGDDAGILTSALVHQFAATGAFQVKTCDADLILYVCLLPPEEENIGFEYAPEKDGSLSNILVSDENRLSITASVSLVERCSGRTIVGPFLVTQSLAFDFEPDLSDDNVHNFSLAQFEMFNLAKDTAFPPLYRLLAEKIVDYVNHSW